MFFSVRSNRPAPKWDNESCFLFLFQRVVFGAYSVVLLEVKGQGDSIALHG